uniref:Leucine rich immune protein (Coil-less) n=1 Tax=Anopheles culicifacies TaxID=139723 RepID=A0A182LZQ3_9DIPT
MFVVGSNSWNVTHIDGNVSCTIVNLTGDSEGHDYSFLTNSTEELIFRGAAIDVLDLTIPLANITPWKVLITNSNLTRVVFPAQMSPSVVHLCTTEVEDVHFEDNNSLQDFRAEYTSLRTISPTVSKLHALDILWVSSSQLTSINFDILVNSTVSLLYLVGNRIEMVTLSPGVVCCQHLEELFLTNNLLKQLDFGTFATMSNLKVLFLENNKLTDLHASVPNLDHSNGEMYCSWHQHYIAQDSAEQELETPNCTDYYATLLSINLARNNLVQLNFSTFSWMNNLNLLDVSKNHLISLIASDGELPLRLSELFASNNNITDVYLAPFKEMKAIYLYDNNVQSLNMSDLPKDLDYLNLVNNPLNCDMLPHKRPTLPVLGLYTEC